MLFRFCFALLAVMLLAAPARSQQAPAAPTVLLTSFEYVTYAIIDQGASPDPIPARGVGGTLSLRPDGTYQKRLTLTVNGNTMPFNQDGRFSVQGDQIRFAYADSHGQARLDQGTFVLRNGLLTLTLQGYPTGNRGVYVLRGSAPARPTAPAPARRKSR